MKRLLQLILVWSIATASLPSFAQTDTPKSKLPYNGVSSLANTMAEYPNLTKELSDLLHQPSLHLSEQVINKVLTSLQCAKQNNVLHNNILTIIDYSLPSSEKRLWVFDLTAKKLLFNTYVSHGIKSGTLFSNYFSNINDSKASSIGVYKTDQAYYGREGLSLRLSGLERSFNDNAANRAVVMHGGWYVDEPFIKKYGRAGRSWGCPALPLSLYQAIINTIKNNSLFVVYYPSDDWFVKSRFLNCGVNLPTEKLTALLTETKPVVPEITLRENVLFAQTSQYNKVAVDAPIVVMAADKYEQFYQVKPPLERMLRRQINKAEYIALSNTEFNRLAANHTPESSTMLSNVYFVVPVLKMVRGYYETEMRIVDLGKIKEVRFNGDASRSIVQPQSYTVYFEGRPNISLRATDRFIRWLGL